MDPNYITEEYYTSSYLMGRKAVLPKGEFLFWEKRARHFVDEYTFDRIKQDRTLVDTFPTEIGECLCELAEFLYLNEGSENKQSESIAGRSASYIKGYEYQVCQKHLLMTGLMYRGSGYVSQAGS